MRFEAGGDIGYQLQLMLNKGLMFSDNMDVVMLTVDLVEGENTIQHSLGRTPLGYIVVLKQNPGNIYGTDTTSWNSQTLSLLSDVMSQKARLIVL